jgi:hypothetical protein
MAGLFASQLRRGLVVEFACGGCVGGLEKEGG